MSKYTQFIKNLHVHPESPVAAKIASYWQEHFEDCILERGGLYTLLVALRNDSSIVFVVYGGSIVDKGIFTFIRVNSQRVVLTL